MFASDANAEMAALDYDYDYYDYIYEGRGGGGVGWGGEGRMCASAQICNFKR